MQCTVVARDTAVNKTDNNPCMPSQSLDHNTENWINFPYEKVLYFISLQENANYNHNEIHLKLKRLINCWNGSTVNNRNAHTMLVGAYKMGTTTLDKGHYLLGDYPRPCNFTPRYIHNRKLSGLKQ